MSEVLMTMGRVEKLVNERRASELEARGWKRVGPKKKKKKEEPVVEAVEPSEDPQSIEELKHE